MSNLFIVYVIFVLSNIILFKFMVKKYTIYDFMYSVMFAIIPIVNIFFLIAIIKELIDERKEREEE